MNDDSFQLPQALRDALQVEAQRPLPGPEAWAATAERIDATMAAAAPAVAGASAAVAHGARTFLARHVLAAFALGAAAGVGGTAALVSRPQPPLAAQEAPRDPLPLEVSPPSSPAAPAVTEEPRAPARPRAAEPSAAAAPTQPGYAADAERLLVEQAISALSRGEHVRALAACEEHRTRFPKGALVEERESLAIRALAAGGHLDRARSRAQQFRKRFQDSLLQPAVDAVLPPPDGAVTDSESTD